jgi:cytochrome c-type biogenesis protein
MFALGQSFSRILPWLLPLTYGIVIVLGITLLLGKNPFARLAAAQSPTLSNPYASAFVYGGLLAPMTLPCTGPVIVSAFVLGVGSAAALSESLLYFLAFGLGFGWPLLVLPFVAIPVQRGVTRWLAGNAEALGRLAGALMLVIAVFGIWTEVLPNLRT